MYPRCEGLFNMRGPLQHPALFVGCYLTSCWVVLCPIRVKTGLPVWSTSRPRTCFPRRSWWRKTTAFRWDLRHIPSLRPTDLLQILRWREPALTLSRHALHDGGVLFVQAWVDGVLCVAVGQVMISGLNRAVARQCCTAARTEAIYTVPFLHILHTEASELFRWDSIPYKAVALGKGWDWAISESAARH